MKKVLLIASAVLLLTGCGTNNGPNFNDWIKLETANIFGGGSFYNIEPSRLIFAQYKSSESLASYKGIQAYGENLDTVYVYTYVDNKEDYDFSNTATFNYSSTSITLTLDGKIVSTVSSTEIYYSASGRTLKQIDNKLVTEKEHNATKLKEMKDKYCYRAFITNNPTKIDASTILFKQETKETYVDLGTTALSYTPYKEHKE